MAARRSLITLFGALLCAAMLVGSEPAAVANPSPPILLTAGSSTANATSYSLGTASFTAGRLYVAFVELSEVGGAVDSTPGIQGAGTSWTKIDGSEASAAKMGLTAYYFLAEDDLADVALQTGTLSTGHEGIWFSVTEIGGDLNETAPVAQYSAGRQGTGTGYTRTLASAPAADSLVIAAFAHAVNETSAPTAGWTELAGSDLGHAAPNRGSNVVYDNTTPGSTAGVTWATSSTRRGIAIEIPSGEIIPPSGDVVLAGAGDICPSFANCNPVSNRVADADPDVVVTMGDLAYQNGLLSEFYNKYGGGTTPQRGWGRPSIKDITLPGYGNHDCYDVPRATGATKQGCDDAVTYFGADSTLGTDIPGVPGSYYKVVGDWLIVQLNSAGDVGSGQATNAEMTAQNNALHDLLMADQHGCELLAWHHPRYSSGGEHGNNAFVDPWFETAYADGVDVVLNGHDHDYERFAPQDGNANAVPDGVREFVVGTGGAETHAFGSTVDNSVVRINDKGIITMQLNDDETYSWQFIDDVTAAVDDSGSGTCHN